MSAWRKSSNEHLPTIKVELVHLFFKCVMVGISMVFRLHLIRESWRRNKAPLYEICNRDTISVDVALIYNATVIHSFQEMYSKTGKAVKEIINRHEKEIQTVD